MEDEKRISNIAFHDFVFVNESTKVVIGLYFNTLYIYLFKDPPDEFLETSDSLSINI